MNSILKKIFNHPALKENPPVLLDIGASGKIHSRWKKVAKYSICIAFDADEREFGFVVNESSGFKKLYIYNCIVTDEGVDEKFFYLTKSPYCSSILEPDNDSLKNWVFADKFEIEKKEKLKNKKLYDVLKELQIPKIDWFKTDSQGLDLRLFKNLGDKIYNNVIVAEFEPGIIDAYKGEDKFYQLLEFMDMENFWMADLRVKGSVRISEGLLNSATDNLLLKKTIQFSLKKSPCWVEATYINSFNTDLSLRDYLLGWMFSTILKQHGFALKLAIEADKMFRDPLLNSLKKYSLKKIRLNIFNFKFLVALMKKIFE